MHLSLQILIDGLQHAPIKCLVDPEGGCSQLVEFRTETVNQPFSLRSEKHANRSRLPETKTFRPLPGRRFIEKHETGLNLISQRKGIGLPGVERLPKQSPHAGVGVDGNDLNPAGRTGRFQL
jgi:hypothetical protein